MRRPSIVIVSPALADANNGNGHTATRWQSMLGTGAEVQLMREWPGDSGTRQADALIALHARRSAASIDAWSRQCGARGLAVVLTGTDLYPDLRADARAYASAWAAQVLVVLQDRAPAALPAGLRERARVIYQSTPAHPPLDKPSGTLAAVACGHLRDVKSPQTLFEAARLLAARAEIRIEHIGEALEPSWRDAALATQDAAPGYRWLGALPHEQTLDAIARAHVLVHASRVEGGAHVVMEAVCAGTPVLASRIDGNVGMLGEDYEGYFEHGDAAALARLLLRCAEGRHDPDGGLLARLQRQCALRAQLFDPERERAALLQLLHDLLEPPSPA